MSSSQISIYDRDDDNIFNIPDYLVNSIAETCCFYDTECTDEPEKTACDITQYIIKKQFEQINTISTINLNKSQIARIAFVVARHHDLMNHDEKPQDFPTVLSVYKAMTVDNNFIPDAQSQLREICGDAVATIIIAKKGTQESTPQQATSEQHKTVTEYGGKSRRKKML